MEIKGELLIGARAVKAQGTAVQAINPATNEALQPVFHGGSQQHVEQAASLAWQAFDPYRATGLEHRPAFLDLIASEILALGDELIVRASAAA